MRTRRSQSSGNPMSHGSTGHRTVLLHEAVDALEIRAGETIVDATLGGAGHAQLIAEKLGDGTLLAFDADAEAIERAHHIFRHDARIHLIHANFRDMHAELEKCGITRIDGAIFDLGWSGYQLSAGRGFSFMTDDLLSMAYHRDQELSAATIVNGWGEDSLTDIIRGWGEERYAARIAHAIAVARTKKTIETARELAAIISAAVPATYRYGRIHPATRTFQALRIAVNDEFGALRDGLTAAWDMLVPTGRVGVISFHSLEDRIVKQQFRAWEDAGSGKRVTKKPIVPSDAETAENPRARSAKLRVIEKTNHEKGTQNQ